MNALLSIDNAELAHGMHPLLDRASLKVVTGERIGFIGRNGTGKSSLLRVINGEIPLDDGELQWAGEHAVVLVEQEPTLPAAASLRNSLVHRGAFERIDDERDRWQLEARLDEYLHRFEIEPEADPGTLSGGEIKRAALALAMAMKADLLLLDEPTNHLDIDAITLLEELLQRQATAIIVSHDRAFLDRVVTRIVELDRGLLRSFPGNFADYQRRKTDLLAEEAMQTRKFDRFWAQEEAWIRQGIKARRTRDEGRVRRLERLREERNSRRERLGNVRLRIDSGERSGKLVSELENVVFSYGERRLVDGLSTRILRGDRVGIIGPNGIGKSTLVRLLLGELAPSQGTVRTGTKLELAYFDQLREQLDPQASVTDSISPGSDWVEVGGRKRHVISYLGDFLFAPQRAGSPVKSLSGGERNRLLLARLFARPANVLILDEPTNDLDIESLELLEDTLQTYDGTLLLVSHDRVFLDNVVTQTLVAEGGGRWQEYVGGYSDWLLQRPPAEAASTADRKPAKQPAPARVRKTPDGAARLSYKETRELAQLPAQIEALEQEQDALIARMSAPHYHRNTPQVLQQDKRRSAEIPDQLEEKFLRWSELEDRAGS